MDYKHDIISIPKSILLAGIILYACLSAFAGKPNHVPFPINTPDSTVISSDVDSIAFSRRFIHRIGVEMRPSYIFPTHPFLQAENEDLSPIRYSHSSHIKYSFQFQPGCNAERIYGGSYQGIGLAHFYFRRQKELGSPIALYLFQGARITPLTSWLSLNYEWNFGLSFGWKPYNFETNSYNRVIGSKLNAYINTNFYLNWILSPRLNLNTGIALTHFSNGNTNYPNAGLNTIGIQLGLTYNFNKNRIFFPVLLLFLRFRATSVMTSFYSVPGERRESPGERHKSLHRTPIWSWDLILPPCTTSDTSFVWEYPSTAYTTGAPMSIPKIIFMVPPRNFSHLLFTNNLHWGFLDGANMSCLTLPWVWVWESTSSTEEAI